MGEYNQVESLLGIAGLEKYTTSLAAVEWRKPDGTPIPEGVPAGQNARKYVAVHGPSEYVNGHIFPPEQKEPGGSSSENQSISKLTSRDIGKGVFAYYLSTLLIGVELIEEKE